MEHVSSSVTLVETKKRSLVPEKWEDQVRVIGISECKEAALSLAQAFATDELAQYLLDAEEDGDESKWRLHVDIFNYIVAAHCYKGVVTTIGPDYEAVALWLVNMVANDVSSSFLFPFFANDEIQRQNLANIACVLKDAARQGLR